jgi:hypothetical protein
VERKRFAGRSRVGLGVELLARLRYLPCGALSHSFLRHIMFDTPKMMIGPGEILCGGQAGSLSGLSTLTSTWRHKERS